MVLEMRWKLQKWANSLGVDQWSYKYSNKFVTFVIFTLFRNNRKNRNRPPALKYNNTGFQHKDMIPSMIPYDPHYRLSRMRSIAREG